MDTPKKTGGSYASLNPESLLLKQKYIEMDLFISFVDFLYSLCFYDRSHRDEIRKKIKTIRKHSWSTSLNEKTRFPEGFLVNMSVGAAAEAFDRIQSTIYVHLLDLNPPMTFADWIKLKETFDDVSATLKRLAYITDPSALADVGIYNRQTFEMRFGLIWNE